MIRTGACVVWSDLAGRYGDLYQRSVMNESALCAPQSSVVQPRPFNHNIVH
jgi:hypothetical protein